MAGVEQGTVRAVTMVRRAAKLLDGLGDTAGAIRLRHAAAVVANDARFPTATGTDIPMSFMKMALALMDHAGRGTSDPAIALQLAIDRLRGSPILAEGEEIDPDLLLPFQPERLH